MARPRTTFDKLQKERARQEKQAAKRARRQGTSLPGAPIEQTEPSATDDRDVEPGVAEAR